MNTRPTIVLLDSHAIIHRAYHALPDLATTSGTPTGAIYGFLMILAGIIEKFKPDHVIAAFDRAEKTFRHEAFDNYKGTRAKTDDALITQINQVRDMCERIGIPLLDAPGFEADDILGTLVEQLVVARTGQSADQYNIVIASGDMDTLQLVVGDQVRVFTMRKGLKDTVIYDENAVRERFGFGPESIPDYKAFRGDTSDNIPGIRGIGEKTATEMISAYPTLAAVYEHIDELSVTPRIRELIRTGRDDAEFSLILATIRRDAPISYEVPETTFAQTFDYAALAEICTEYEFKNMADKFKKVLSGGAATVSEPNKAPQKVEAAPESVRATETVAAPQELAIECDPALLRRMQIMRWLLDTRNIHESIGTITAATRTTTADDAYQSLVAQLQKDGLYQLWIELEEPLIPIMTNMQDHGILVDVSVLDRIGKGLTTDLARLEQEIYAYTGEININSPKQLGDALYDTLQIKPKRIKKTATGGRTTKEEELQKMRDLHPVIDMILEYREKQKLNSTYIEPLTEMVDSDSRLHPILWQDGTTTGRFSSEKPNIQNLPIRTELGKSIRSSIAAPAGYSLVKMDYSQIELRVTAILSGDEFMQQVFRDGRDIHTEVAARVFHVEPQDVTADMRRKAKVINFGIIYGMGIQALQKNLESTRDEAETFYAAYFAQFPTIQEYFDRTIAAAARTGYSETLWKRRRYFPEITSRLPYLRAAAERMAMNAPIQGTATADIIKFGMLDAARVLTQFPGNYMIAQIHDELLFEIRNEDIDTLVPQLRATLQNVLSVHAPDHAIVPLVVEVGVGPNWGETKTV